jgi:hypothetical protein
MFNCCNTEKSTVDLVEVPKKIISTTPIPILVKPDNDKEYKSIIADTRPRLNPEFIKILIS